MSAKPELEVVRPQWEAPSNVHALFTLRRGGVSAGPWGASDGFNGLNLGTHVSDSPYAVRANRRIVSELLPGEPAWLTQVHSTQVLRAEEIKDAPQADASYTLKAGLPCVIMTADCVPVLFCDTKGRIVGAAHAGWRGLAGGVIKETLKNLRLALGDEKAEWCAWIGPCIRKENFQVRCDVRNRFLASGFSEFVSEAFEAGRDENGKEYFLADLALLVRRALEKEGLSRIADCRMDTYANAELFYSYRREGTCGRHGAFIWRTEDKAQ